MRNAIWIGRRQVKGLIILLALLPLIPTSMLVHTLFQNSAKDQFEVVHEMNQMFRYQLGLATERFSKDNNQNTPRSDQDFVRFLTYVFGEHLPMIIRSDTGDLIYRSPSPMSQASVQYKVREGEFKDWLIAIDSITEMPRHLQEITRTTMRNTIFALLGTILIAGGVWFAVNRGLRVDEIRKDLITTISHEIKTPVSAIKILTESLESGELDATREAEYIKLIASENERIEQLANRFLTYGRLEKGQLPIENKATDLNQTLKDVISLLNPRFEAANGDLATTGETDLSVYGDANGLEILLTNLTENGLKYGGKPPRVLIDIKTAAESAIITISDNGKGIPIRERKAVFRRFYRSEGRLDDGQTGVGLGLAICRRVVKMMHGSLAVGDSVNPDYSGAEFQITIPLAK